MKRPVLRRSTGLSRTSRLRPRSRKTARVQADRRAFVARLLRERPRCEAAWDSTCTLRSVDVHEPLSRARGGSILDEANALAVCRRCHGQIHANPAESERRGLLRPRRAA